MEIVGFVDEERLNGMFLSRDITELDYVKHHSQRDVGCLLFLHCRQQPS